MPKFNVAVSKRYFANIQVEADSAEDADRVANEMHRSGKIDSSAYTAFDAGEAAEDFVVDWVD